MYLIQCFLVVCLVLAVISSALSLYEAEVAWQNFKLDHSKQYRSLREEKVRKQIFLKNFDAITEHNKLYQDGILSYSLKINHLADLTNDEITKTLKGYKTSKVNLREIEVIQFLPDENTEIPDEFDWREKGAITPIKDQGFCGSCWSFSSTGALEGQYFLKTGKLVSLSEQNLMDCSSENDNKGCNGGDMVPSFIHVHDQDGIDSEISYPYEAAVGKCRYTVSGNVTSTKGYGTIESGNEEYLKAAIVTVGPIAVGIDSSDVEFDFYDEGIYYNPECTNGLNDLNHAMLAVGYGTENGQDYWLIKNSWGTDWGMEGYVKMARNRKNNCGVATEASYPLNY